MRKETLILAFIAVIFSCEEKLENITPEEVFTPEFVENNDAIELTKRISFTNEEVMSSNSVEGSVTYTKVAEVAPNTINGYGLSATGLSRLNNNIYVTYHVRGEVYGGEILTFDISNPSQPTLLSSIVDESADFNDVMTGQHKGNIWVAGARDIYVSGYGNTNGAIATKIGLNSDKTPENKASWEVPLLSYSASSITRVDPPAGASNGRIFITSGSKGGLEVVRGNDENEIFHSRQANEAKHFDYFNDKGVFLRGTGVNSAVIDVYALDDSFSYQTYPLPYDVTYLGKNGIDVTDQYAFLAMGDDGLIKIDITNGNITNTFKSSGSGDANSVYVHDGLVYLANGSDGLVILNESDLSLVGNYKFNGSCNYVEVQDNLVFIANGSTGGLIILEKS